MLINKGFLGAECTPNIPNHLVRLSLQRDNTDKNIEDFLGISMGNKSHAEHTRKLFILQLSVF